MTRRAMVLWGALLATLAASWWAVRSDDGAPMLSRPGVRGPTAPTESIELAPPGVNTGVPSGTDVSVEALRIRREAWPAWAAGLLQPMSFAPPAQALPDTANAAAVTHLPDAPPLPFRYVGAIEEAGERAAILMEGDDVRIVRARQRIGERYRVEQITATQIEFTYLPLMQRQLLGTSRHEQYQ